MRTKWDTRQDKAFRIQPCRIKPELQTANELLEFCCGVYFILVFLLCFRYVLWRFVVKAINLNDFTPTLLILCLQYDNFFNEPLSHVLPLVVYTTHYVIIGDPSDVNVSDSMGTLIFKITVTLSDLIYEASNIYTSLYMNFLT